MRLMVESVDGEHSVLVRALAVGAVSCAAVAAAWVAFDGITIDETVAPAQVLTGSVVYPPGHPTDVYFRGVPSLGNQIAALQWKILPNLTLLSGSRNFLVMWGNLWVPFALTLLLSRLVPAAALAAALSLTEMSANLQGLYPLTTWPMTWSHGNIGNHAAALTVVLVLLRSWMSAGVFLGLLPVIHFAMVPVVWPWAAIRTQLDRSINHRALI